MVSNDGHAILLWLQNWVDESGQSYYGHHALKYVQLLGGRDRQEVHLFDGQLLDAKWLEDSSGFIVISGN